MKAVVLEVRRGEAAILAMDGTVRRVRGNYQVGQEIDYDAPARPTAWQWITAVLVAAILLSASAGLWINENYVAYAEISLDAGPSIVYTLNRRNRVLSLEALNEDALAVVEGLADVRFMPIGDAVERTLDFMADEGYLNSDSENYVLAGVSADDERTRESLSEQVEAAMSRPRDDAPPLEYQIERTDRETAGEARARGMSPGRYAAWAEAPKDRAPEEFADMPVREIMGKGASEAPQDEGQGHSEREPAEPSIEEKSPVDGQAMVAPAERNPEAPSADERQTPPAEGNDNGAPAEDNPNTPSSNNKPGNESASASDREAEAFAPSGHEAPAQSDNNAGLRNGTNSNPSTDSNPPIQSQADDTPTKDSGGTSGQEKPSTRSDSDKPSSRGSSGERGSDRPSSSGDRGPGGGPGGR